LIQKLLYRTILFLLPLVVLVIGIGLFDNIDKSTTENNNILSIQYKNNFDSLDVLFIGNSYCYSGIIPELFDSVFIKTYNLGIATCGPIITKLLLDDYILHATQKPKVVMILLTPISFTNYADNLTQYPIHRYLLTPFSNENIAIRFNLFEQYPEMAAKSFSKGMTNILFRSKSNNTEEVLNIIQQKGYVASYDTFTNNKKNDKNSMYMSLMNNKFDSVSFRLLIEELKGFESQNTKVLFFELPSNHLTNYFDQKFLIDYNQSIQYLKKNNLILTTELPSEPKYFRDIDHLNHFGAEVVTKQLISLIKENAILK